MIRLRFGHCSPYFIRCLANIIFKPLKSIMNSTLKLKRTREKNGATDSIHFEAVEACAAWYAKHR